MPKDRSDDDDTVAENVGGIDTEVLEQIGQHLRQSHRFSEIVFQPEYAPSSVVAEYDTGYFPAAIDRAYLQIRWYETNDFNVHYSEQYTDGDQWECRWDRHPNSHNTHSHFHPPPNATTPGTDADYARDWRDVLSRVLEDLDDRIKAFWA
ncbi:hypothetical protein [Haladaptatus caseinilyticus]|uniref:hypothetical protein n=1 Tax=Haladaptatus caseinilyticus TaxID=2993314 RepID=UPI00224A8825|nr:hypothetical protein [Haladaptatus caseinilyticus]